MNKRLLFLLLFFVLPIAANAACPNGNATHSGNECIVKANGTGSTCTEASPCAMSGAQSIAAAGDQVWMRDDGGVYNGRFTWAFAGSAGNLITVRSHCGSNGICDDSDDHHPKVDSYFGTTLTAAIIGTTITAAFNSSNTTCSTPIPLADSTGFSSGMTLFVENEEFTANTISGGSITNCTRPSAATHANGSGIGPGCTSVNISLADASGVNNGDTIIIQNGSVAENINVLHKTGNNIDNCFRAWDATPPLARVSGSQVDVVGTAVTDDSDYTRFGPGLEIYSSYPQRAFASGLAGDWTTKRGSCVFFLGAHNEWVGNVLHDCNHGLFTSSSSGTLVFQDNLIFNQGLVNTDPNGLGWYTENEACGPDHVCGTGDDDNPNTKTFRNNISYGNYSSCGKIYSESLGQVERFTIDKIICYQSGAAIAAMSSGRPAGYGTTTRTNGLQIGGGGTPNVADNTLSNSIVWEPLNSTAFYFGGLWLGYQGGGSNNSITNNYVVAPQTIGLGPLGTNVTFTGNTVIQPLTGLSGSTTIMGAFRQAGNTGWVVNSNAYYDMRDAQTFSPDSNLRYSFSYSTNAGSPLPTGCCHDAAGGGGSSGASQLGFNSTNLWSGGSGSPSCTNGSCNSPSGTGWKSWSGFDAASTYTGGSLPTTNVTGCYVKSYGPAGGHCYIYNWEGLSTVSLNISGLGLANGDTYGVFDSSNWTDWTAPNAIATGTYNGASPTVNIPMSTLSTVRKPTGTSNTISHSASSGAAGGFAAVIVQKTGVGAAPSGGSGPGIRSRVPDNKQ